MRLLERDAALGALHEYAADADRGDGRLVLVHGEAGIGKTALLERFRAELPGARWSWGNCDPPFTARPLGPLFDIVEQLGGQAGELARAEESRAALVAALVERVTDATVLDVMVIEDAHWGDEGVLLLRQVARHLGGARAMIVITYRDDELRPDQPMRLALGDLTSGSWSRRIALARLGHDAVAQLLDDSGLDPGEVLRVTGGNPFFVTEVARSPSEGVPATARDVVLARVARLTPGARGVLERAALIGFRVDLPVLQATVAPDDPAEALDELLTTGLLVEDAGGLRFRHEIARMAVAGSVRGYRAVPIHKAILRALLALGTTEHARLATHAAAAGDAARVLEHAPAAAQEAVAVGAHREAVGHYREAVRAAATADPVRLAELQVALAVELSLLDCGEDAVVQLQAALATWRATGNHLREGATLRRLSRAMWGLCRGAEAIEYAEQAVAVLDPLFPGGELAWAIANLAEQRLFAGRYAEAIALAQRARREGDRWRLHGVASDSLNTEACASLLLGQEWEPLIRRSLALAVEHRVHEQAGRAYANLVPLLAEANRQPEAAATLAEGLAYCEETDLDTFRVRLGGYQALLHLHQGRSQEAIRLADRLLASEPSPVNRINPLIAGGLARARLGAAGAWPLLEEALRLALGTQEVLSILPARIARVEARWLEGDAEGARREVRAILERDAPLGPAEQAAAALWFARVGAPGGPAVPAHARQAARLELQGDRAAAAAAWTEIGRPYEAAVALLGSTEEDELREAFRRFERLGALPALRLAKERMRDAGIRHVPAGARRSTLADPRGLTERESEVLRYLAAGRSNKEIAHALVVSIKTVDHHVSAVLSKLGVHTRAQAAALVLAEREAAAGPGVAGA